MAINEVNAAPLMGRLVAADQKRTFEEFVLGQSTALLRVAYLLTGDRHQAEDLLQGVLERMYARWKRVTDNPNAYARRALVNAANSRWRRRRPETSLRPEHDRGQPDRTEAVVVQDAVVRALRELTAKQRAVVVLRYLEDMSEAETAAVLRVSVGTVKAHGSRGLARLREALHATEGRGR